MAFGSTPVDQNGIPIGSVYVPNTGFKALQGGPVYTDGSANDSAPVAIAVMGGWKQTFAASYVGLAGVSGVLFLLVGSATKTIRLVRIAIGGAATAATFDLTLTKYSSAYSSGVTVGAATIAPLDSTDAAASATTVAFSTAPTPGTSVGIVRATKITFFATAATTSDEKVVWKFGALPEQAPTLRGIAQAIGLTLSGAPASGAIDVDCTWSEE